MAKASVDGVKLKKALDEFGSLEKAVESRKLEVDTLSKQKQNLKQQNEELSLSSGKLKAGLDVLNKQIHDQKGKLELLTEKLGKWERQYNLFEAFLAMLDGSPSVDSSLKSLISLLQELAVSGWAITKSADDLRSHFVRTIIGDYLKCFRCKLCEAKFIVNQKPGFSDYYECPSCHTSYGVESDDSFLKAMVSEKQVENITLVEKTLKENQALEQEKKALEPLKAFLDVPCQICAKPITEWTKYNVQAAIEGWGWAHDKCWHSDIGWIKVTLKLYATIHGKSEAAKTLNPYCHLHQRG